MDFREQITKKLEALRLRNLSKEERVVMRLFHRRWLLKDGPVIRMTQSEIAVTEDWMGAHSKYEGTSRETTLRKVRQVVRDLRVNHHAPILSDRGGYWIPVNQSDVSEYLLRIESEARAQAASWFETYKAVRETFGLRSEYLEKQERLFKA